VIERVLGGFGGGLGRRLLGLLPGLRNAAAGEGDGHGLINPVSGAPSVGIRRGGCGPVPVVDCAIRARTSGEAAVDQEGIACV